MFFNFLLWLSGLLLPGIGVCVALDKWSSREAFKLFDVMFNFGFNINIGFNFGLLLMIMEEVIDRDRPCQ